MGGGKTKEQELAANKEKMHRSANKTVHKDENKEQIIFCNTDY